MHIIPQIFCESNFTVQLHFLQADFYENDYFYEQKLKKQTALNRWTVQDNSR